MASSQIITDQITPSRFLQLPPELRYIIYEMLFQSEILRPFSRKPNSETSPINISHTCGKVRNEVLEIITKNGIFAIDIGMNYICILAHQMARNLNLQVVANNLAQYGDLRRLAIQITWDYKIDLFAMRIYRKLEEAVDHIESLMKSVRCILEYLRDLEHVTVTFSTPPEISPWDLPSAMAVQDFLRPLEIYKSERPGTVIVVRDFWKITGQELQKGEKEYKTLSECMTEIADLSKWGIPQAIWTAAPISVPGGGASSTATVSGLTLPPFST